MKIKIDPRAIALVDESHVRQLIVTALMLAGSGAGALVLLIAAIGSLADWTGDADERGRVLRVAVESLMDHLAGDAEERILHALSNLPTPGPEPDWQKRVMERIDEIDRKKGQT